MPKNYIEYSFLVLPSDPWEEILLAELQSLPFECLESIEPPPPYSKYGEWSWPHYRQGSQWIVC